MLSRPLAACRQHGHLLLTKPIRAQVRTASSSSTQAPQSRISRFESRLPSFLRRYTTPLRSAPVSHITAFLVLHEITAVVPLFGLAAAFHYFDWLPPWFAEGVWVKQGVEKFGRYARRKGWIEDEEGLGEDAKQGRLRGSSWGKWWGFGEGGVRVVVEFATAYAVTKALLPLRLVVSVWGTPWFARWTVLPVAGWVRRAVGWGGGVTRAGSAAAGTNAVGGGVLPSKGK